MMLLTVTQLYLKELLVRLVFLSDATSQITYPKGQQLFVPQQVFPGSQHDPEVHMRAPSLHPCRATKRRSVADSYSDTLAWIAGTKSGLCHVRGIPRE